MMVTQEGHAGRTSLGSECKVHPAWLSVAEAGSMRVLDIHVPLAFSTLPFRRKDSAQRNLKEEGELSTSVIKDCDEKRVMS